MDISSKAEKLTKRTAIQKRKMNTGRPLVVFKVRATRVAWNAVDAWDAEINWNAWIDHGNKLIWVHIWNTLNRGLYESKE